MILQQCSVDLGLDCLLWTAGISDLMQFTSPYRDHSTSWRRDLYIYRIGKERILRKIGGSTLGTLTQAEIQNVLDQVMQDMTKRVGGICLHKRDTMLSSDMCTIYTTFEGSYRGALILCADTTFWARLARYIMQEDTVDPNDFEDLAKEYFNVVCGQIAAGLYRISHSPSRFRIPVFYVGRYVPIEDDGTQNIINYTSDQNEGAQLIHQLISA